MSAPVLDLVWRSQMSSLLAELIKEVLELTEVVMQIAARCEALEQAARNDGEDATPAKGTAT